MSEERAYDEREPDVYELGWCRKCGAIEPHYMGKESNLTDGSCPADDDVHEPERFVSAHRLKLAEEAYESLEKAIEASPLYAAPAKGEAAE